MLASRAETRISCTIDEFSFAAVVSTAPGKCIPPLKEGGIQHRKTHFPPIR
jgi:hypothetical protein